MNDIVDDLRQMTGMDHVGTTAHKAADEIERLRVEVARLEYRLESDIAMNRRTYGQS